MSINAVSVNECSVDALCGSRRTAIINTLVGLLPTEETGKGRSAAISPVIVRDVRWRDMQRDEEEIVETEQPLVAVTVTFNGIKNTHTLERLSIDDLPLVTVRSLRAAMLTQEDAPEILVNISNISTRIDK